MLMQRRHGLITIINKRQRLVKKSRVLISINSRRRAPSSEWLLILIFLCWQIKMLMSNEPAMSMQLQ
jgi:hypothetical protein